MTSCAAIHPCSHATAPMPTTAWGAATRSRAGGTSCLAYRCPPSRVGAALRSHVKCPPSHTVSRLHMCRLHVSRAHLHVSSARLHVPRVSPSRVGDALHRHLLRPLEDVV